MTVQPGDHMHVSAAATVPNSNVWVITLQDATRNETFSQTVPYSSSQLTAEWIEETRTPSAPDPDADGFNACTWATSCSAPSGS